MQDADRQLETDRPQQQSSNGHSQSTDWYSEGDARIVEIDGVSVLVQFVGRRGRRGRISITSPAGASYRSVVRRS
jgi:hypothetical protein